MGIPKTTITLIQREGKKVWIVEWVDAYGNERSLECDSEYDAYNFIPW